MDEKRFAGIRFATLLGADERGAFSRDLGSVGTPVTSWSDAGGRTYARIAFDSADIDAGRLAALAPGARVDVPPLVVLRITPDRTRDFPALAAALGGPGRPAGVTSSATDGDALLVEVDVRTTPLSSIVASIDVEVSGDRRIEPLFPLSDADLTDVAGAILGMADLGPERLIETYLEPLLGPGRS